MLKKIKLQSVNKIYTFFPKTFRDYRDSTLFYADNRWKNNMHPNPYRPQFTLTESEIEENNKKPVYERILEWDKYMKHKGKLKYTTGEYLADVEPFPRLKVMMLCDISINLLHKINDDFSYKHLTFEFIKHVMKVVDENESIIDIEKTVSSNFLIRYQFN